MNSEHPRNPARSSIPRGSNGRGARHSLAPSEQITGPVGEWLKKAAIDLTVQHAMRAYQESQLMPGYTPSSPPIAEIPLRATKAPKRHLLDRFDFFCAVTAIISLIGIAAHVWG